MTKVVFPVPVLVDPENDKYDEECDSWSHGDELGLAISTETVPSSFNFDFSSAFDNLQSMDINSASPVMPHYHLVKLASLNDLPEQTSTLPSDLKSKHSTTSSLDSGYGSFGHASKSASVPTSLPTPEERAKPKPPARSRQE